MIEEALFEYINQYAHLTETEWQAMSGLLTTRRMEKKELLAVENKPCTELIFTNKGYFRFFHHDTNGEEVTSDFYFAPTFITSYTSFITGEPSFVNVQAMEAMEVLVMKKMDLQALYLQYPGIERVGRLLAEMVAIASERHLFLLLNQTAEKRYKRLMEQQPQYINTIPMQYIASYLGITRETLSRMRKNL